MPFNYGDDTGLYTFGGWGLIWITFGGCRGCDCTRRAPSTAAKARGAIGWVIRCGTVLCLCACGVSWLVVSSRIFFLLHLALCTHPTVISFGLALRTAVCRCPLCTLLSTAFECLKPVISTVEG